MIGHFWIGLGGALGSMGRAWLAVTVARITGPQFPWGHPDKHHRFVRHRLLRHPYDKWQPLCRAGRCPRGFTTFSSFSLQTLELARGGRAAQALGNIALSVVLCLLAVAAGHYGAAAIHHRYTGAGVMEANNNATSWLPFSTAFHAPLTLVPPSRRVPFSCVRALSRWSILFAALDFAPLLWRLAWLKPVEPPQRPACLPAEA